MASCQNARCRRACFVVQLYSSTPARSPESPCDAIRPSGSRPMSSGSRRTYFSDAGTMVTIAIAPSSSQATRQPKPSIKYWVRGRNSTAPSGAPMERMATARERLATNHFSTGTAVVSWLGPRTPTKPMRPISTMSCQPESIHASAMTASPAMSVVPASSQRAPWRSTRRPIQGLVTAPAMERTLPAHPNSARLMPSSSPIGLMNNPRFSEANAWPMALAAVSTATMTQP